MPDHLSDNSTSNLSAAELVAAALADFKTLRSYHYTLTHEAADATVARDLQEHMNSVGDFIAPDKHYGRTVSSTQDNFELLTIGGKTFSRVQGEPWKERPDSSPSAPIGKMIMHVLAQATVDLEYAPEDVVIPASDSAQVLHIHTRHFHYIMARGGRGSVYIDPISRRIYKWTAEVDMEFTTAAMIVVLSRHNEEITLPIPPEMQWPEQRISKLLKYIQKSG